MGTKSKVVCIFAGLLIIAYSIVMMRRGNFYFSTKDICYGDRNGNHFFMRVHILCYKTFKVKA